MNEFELISQFINDGDLIQNPDGTFRMSEKLHEVVVEMFNKHPELYPQVFPDRVN